MSNTQINTKTENIEEISTNLKKDNEALKNTMNVLEDIIKGNNTQTNTYMEKNKEAAEALLNLSNFRKKIYDFAAKNTGLNMYKIDNKQELKKISNNLKEVNKYMSTLEKELEGEEVYQVRNTIDEATIDYWNRIDPKKKGLYFREQQIKDMNFMLKNMEQEYEASIDAIEEKIELIENKIKDKEYSNDSKNNLRRQRIFLRRNIDVRNQKIKSLQLTIDKYISEQEDIENQIHEKQNLLYASRDLYTTVEQSLKIIKNQYVTDKNNTNSNTTDKLRELTDVGTKLKNIVEKYATTRLNEKDKLFDDIKTVTTNTKGENIIAEYMGKNKAKYEEDSAYRKAKRDKYFENLGF